MHQSLWIDITRVNRKYPVQQGETEVDVAVIGGGITGLTTALQLHEAGRRVALIEEHRIGSGTTGFSTGNLYVPVQPYFRTIESKYDIDKARIIAASRNRAIDYVEEVARIRNIDCDFNRRPWFYYTTDESDVQQIEKEVEVMERAGVDVRFVSDLPLPLRAERAARVENSARFNPLKYVASLADQLSDGGCLIFENSPALEVNEYEDHCAISTPGGRIISTQVVSATHIPKGVNSVQMVAAPYRSYAIAVRLRGKDYPDGNFWDTSSPHHAISTHSTSSAALDLLVVAGNHHKTGQAQDNDHEKHYRSLEQYIRKLYDVESVAYRWSAQHYHSGDGIPYIGPATGSARRHFIATGYYADGLTYGTLAGILVSDLILGRDNPWTSTYDSQRFHLIQSAGEFIKENANVFAQYLKDYPGNVEAKNYSEIPAGEGRVMQKGGEKLAAYRDLSGELKVLSAVCTHMACIVRWNNAEKTWDCPCHGSRYTTDGEVIEGPAYKGLEKKIVDEFQER